MKKCWIVLLIVVFAVTLPVSAADAVDTQAMEDSLNGEETVFGGVSEILSAVLENRLSLDGKSVADSLLNLFFLAFKKSLPSLAGLFAVGVLLSLAKSMELLHGRIEEAALLGGRLAIGVLLLSSCLSFITGAKEAVTAASRFAEAVMPPLVTLLVSCGAVGTAAQVTPSFTLLSSVMMSAVVNLLFPILLAALVISVLHSVLPQSRLGGLAGFFKSGASWLLGGLFTVFAGILSVQGLTGGLKDSASLRSVRYALSTSVPVIGGAVGESLSALLVSAGTLKGAVGITGILVIAGILIVPLLNLIAYLLSLRLLAACMAPFAGEDVLTPIKGVCDCLRLIAATLVGIGVLWFLFLGILVGAGGAF